jgi:hypothetical protein
LRTVPIEHLVQLRRDGIERGVPTDPAAIDHVLGDEALLRYTIAGSAAVLFPAAALCYWAGVRPYRERMLAMRAAGAPV